MKFKEPKMELIMAEALVRAARQTQCDYCHTMDGRPGTQEEFVNDYLLEPGSGEELVDTHNVGFCMWCGRKLENEADYGN